MTIKVVPKDPPPLLHGDLMKRLKGVVDNDLRDLLRQPFLWKSKKIRYETPHVDRVWMQLDDTTRLFVHRIHPCEVALSHPHPWPSAVLLLSGSYEMGIAHGHPQGDPFFPGAVPPLAAIVDVHAPSGYEMTHPWGWHYVKPREVVYSVMLTGRPFPKFDGYIPVGSDKVHEPLLAYEEDALRQAVMDLL